MTGPARAALYTPDLLALAVSLADCPFDPAAPFTGEARSPTCGSTVRLSLSLDSAGRIDGVGVHAAACAVGQAAAALFAQGAAGHDRASLAEHRAAIARWLERGGALPDWPGLAAIAPARDYPARHGAILLPWDAALAALSKPQGDR